MTQRSPRFVLAALLVAFAAVPAAAQDAWEERLEEEVRREEERVERERQRAEERLQQAQERLERAQERAAERVARQIERGADWDWDTWEGRNGRRHDGFRLLLGRSFHLPKGQTLDRPLIVIGNSATIEGRAEDDVVVVGGTVRVGPEAEVLGDVVALGGDLDLSPTARVTGEVDSVSITGPGGIWRDGWFGPVSHRWWAMAGLMLTLGRIAFVVFLGIVIEVVAPRWVAEAEHRVGTSAVTAGLAGLAGEILFLPALLCLVVALTITVVGIPLLLGIPFLLIGFGLMWVGGYAAVASVIGARLRGGGGFWNGFSAMNVIVGAVVLSGLTLIGHAMMFGPGWMLPFAAATRAAGWFVEYIGWTIGLGAALTAWRQRPNRGMEPPPVPPGTVPPIPTPEPA